MKQPHYSLRWNNHQNHILAAFDALLQAKTLVDVTLSCTNMELKAHKVVLSACSPYFERIFSEHPGEYPIVILKDFDGWEMEAILTFMYKGEVSILHEQLHTFMKAGENLQVRGLTDTPPSIGSIGAGGGDNSSASIINQTPTPSTSPNDYDRNFFSSGKYSTPLTVGIPDRTSPYSPVSVQNNYDHLPIPVKLPHMNRLSFQETLVPRQESQSPQPRRKQARPRRRSGDMCAAQDLSTSAGKASSPIEETAENLCIKKNHKADQKDNKDEDKCKSPTASTGSAEMDVSVPSVKEFRASPVHPVINFKQDIDRNSPLTYPPMPTISALAMTPPHSKFFGLDSHLGLFPPGLDGCRNPLFDLPDPRNTADPQIFTKKKMGRPKGQHSAPRGGPPRSWTNAELTEALQHVWNKKMTTSQASRIFGIPYNSLLMYVRGKYGKSLKLEQLRKDCIGGPNAPPVDILSMSGPNNNNPCKAEQPEQIQPNTRPSSREDVAPQPPVFHPFPHNFYNEFGSFTIPFNMLQIGPQNEKLLRDHFTSQPMEDDCKERVKELDDEQEMLRQAALSVEDRRELVQQNGQD